MTEGAAVKPSFLITVDTELSNFPDGQGLWGRVGNEAWGLARMIDEFDAMGVKGTFFLDVYGRQDADVAEQDRLWNVAKKATDGG